LKLCPAGRRKTRDTGSDSWRLQATEAACGRSLGLRDGNRRLQLRAFNEPTLSVSFGTYDSVFKERGWRPFRPPGSRILATFFFVSTLFFEEFFATLAALVTATDRGLATQTQPCGFAASLAPCEGGGMYAQGFVSSNFFSRRALLFSKTSCGTASTRTISATLSPFDRGATRRVRRHLQGVRGTRRLLA